MPQVSFRVLDATWKKIYFIHKPGRDIKMEQKFLVYSATLFSVKNFERLNISVPFLTATQLQIWEDKLKWRKHKSNKYLSCYFRFFLVDFTVNWENRSYNLSCHPNLVFLPASQLADLYNQPTSQTTSLLFVHDTTCRSSGTLLFFLVSDSPSVPHSAKIVDHRITSIMLINCKSFVWIVIISLF